MTIYNHGTLVLLDPGSEEATEWLAEHTDGTWWGGCLVVEPRYLSDLLAGMQEDGF